MVEENLPRLELTDLLIRIQRFSHQPLRVRKGNIKCYPIDPALRNAVLKTWGIPDATGMGLYAENLVIRELNSWPERIEVSYFREQGREVDFIFSYGGNQHLPIEVKHRKTVEEIEGLQNFMQRFKLKFGLVITLDQTIAGREILQLPLRYFLLAS